MLNENRVISADILRVMASFLVIMLHVSGVIWMVIDIYSLEWQIINVFNCLARCCVQIFIMLSGMLFLNPNKNISTRDIYIKYLPRIIVALLFWSCIYMIYKPINIELFKSMILTILKGETNYHLWFLYMVIGLYIVTPILRIITANSSKKQIEYFLIVGIVISVIIPTLSGFYPFNYLAINASKMYINLPTAYVVYYMLGYYLTYFDLNNIVRKVIYLFGILGAAFTIFVTRYLTLKNDVATDAWQGIFTINMMFYSVAIFIFLKKYFDKKVVKPKIIKIISLLSSCSFGVFLIHDLFIKYLIRQDILTVNITAPIIMIPLISLTIFIISILITYGLKKIPYISKYIT